MSDTIGPKVLLNEGTAKDDISMHWIRSHSGVLGGGVGYRIAEATRSNSEQVSILRPHKDAMAPALGKDI